MNNDNVRLKIGLLVDSTFVPRHVAELVDWGKCQHKIIISHLFVQNTPLEKPGIIGKALSKIRQYGFSSLMGATLLYLVKKVEGFLLLRQRSDIFHLEKYDISGMVANIVRITPIVSKSGFVHRYSDDDVLAIKRTNVDILIRCGSGILRGEILSCTRFGIISFHHGDNRVYRGGPAGFWEVYHKADSTGFVIQILTDELDGGKVLMRGSFSTKGYFLLNQAELFSKANAFLMRLLNDIAINGRLPLAEKGLPYSEVLYTTPSFIHILYYMHSVSSRFLAKVYARAIRRRKYTWSVGYVNSCWRDAVLRRLRAIENPDNHYLADPFLFNYLGCMYCFVEDFDCDVGRASISVYRHENGDFVRLGEVLVEDFHLSFPYVFEANGTVYMCPETHQAKQVRLYEAKEFPRRWELSRVLIDGIIAGDPIVFNRSGYWWLFVNVSYSDNIDLNSVLEIYYSDDLTEGEWRPHKSNPVCVDSTKGRNGGFFKDGDSYYRVGQRQGFDIYGRSSQVFEIVELTPEAYEERLITSILPNYLEGILGTHHLHSVNGVTVVDYMRLE